MVFLWDRQGRTWDFPQKPGVNFHPHMIHRLIHRIISESTNNCSANYYYFRCDWMINFLSPRRMTGPSLTAQYTREDGLDPVMRRGDNNPSRALDNPSPIPYTR